MSKIYFSKSGVSNRIPDSKGVIIKFQQLADDRGIIELDEEKDAQLVADLKQYQEKKLGGVREVNEDEAEALKKSLPHSPKQPDQGVKLHRSPVPFASTATARAAANPAVAGSHVRPVTEQAEPKPAISSKNTVRTGRVNSPQPSTPPASAVKDSTAATTEQS